MDKLDRAFPATFRQGECEVTTLGLTKREYFAALAMQGLMADTMVDRRIPGTDYTEAEVTAERAVLQADALIKALSVDSEGVAS